MVKILREADRAPVAEVAKRCGVSDATICGWREPFAQLEAMGVKRLRQIHSSHSRSPAELGEPKEGETAVPSFRLIA